MRETDPTIHRTILIEELVTMLPESIGYLMEKGMKCLACGEPMWGTLEDAAREKGCTDDQIDETVRELRLMARKGSSSRIDR